MLESPLMRAVAQPMSNWGVGRPSMPQFEASRPFSVWALISGHSPRGVCAYMVNVPPVAMGTGMAPGNTDRSCVCMIAITALQQGKRTPRVRE